MSWPQWPVAPGGWSATTVATPATPGITAGLTSGTQYTADQWAAMTALQQQNWHQWVQWQQQYQQWQAQYGEQYAKSMALTNPTQPYIAATTLPVQPPLPAAETAVTAPPLPKETRPPLPPEEPPKPTTSTPIPQSNSGIVFNANVPPPLLPNQSNQGYTTKGSNQGYTTQGNTETNNQGYTTQGSGPVKRAYGPHMPPNTNQQPKNISRFNQNNPPSLLSLNFTNQRNQNFTPDKSDFNNKRPGEFRDTFEDAKKHRWENKDESSNRWENKDESSNWSSNDKFQQGSSSNVNNSKPWMQHGHDNVDKNKSWSHSSSNDNNENWKGNNQTQNARNARTNRPNVEELSDAEKNFDQQFEQWESQFNKWKDQNVGHPDKQQYKEYEAKWESWRAQLLERREQMRKKRLGICPTSGNTSKTASDNNLHLDESVKETLQSESVPNDNPLPIKTTPAVEIKVAESKVSESKAPLNEKEEKAPENELDDSSCSFLFSQPPKEQRTNIRSRRSSIKQDSEPVPAPPIDTSFLQSSHSSAGIPGLDLVKDDDNKEDDSDKKQLEVENKIQNLEAISQGINSILGDEKLLNMLSMVSQNKKVEPETSTPVKDNTQNQMNISNEFNNTQSSNYSDNKYNNSYSENQYYDEGNGFINKGPQNFNRPPNFDITNRPPNFDITNRPPTFDITNRPPNFDITNRPPNFDITNRPPNLDVDDRIQKFDNRPPNFDTRPPNFENRPPPNFANRPPPNFDNRGPNFDNRPPSFDNRGPNFDNRPQSNFDNRQQPKFNNRPPSLLDSKFPSLLDDRTPLLGNRPPRIDDRAPSLLGSRPPPLIDDRTPSLLGNRPPSLIDDRTPSLLGNRPPPLMDDRNPSLLGNRPPPLMDNRLQSKFENRPLLDNRSQPNFDNKPPSLLGNRFQSNFENRSQSNFDNNRPPPNFDNRSQSMFDNKPFDNKPFDNKPFDNKPFDNKPFDNKPFDSKPFDSKPFDNKPFDNKPFDNMPFDNKSFDNKPFDIKPFDNKPFDNKHFDNQPFDNKLNFGNRQSNFDNRFQDNFENRSRCPPNGDRNPNNFLPRSEFNNTQPHQQNEFGSNNQGPSQNRSRMDNSPFNKRPDFGQMPPNRGPNNFNNRGPNDNNWGGPNGADNFRRGSDDFNDSFNPSNRVTNFGGPFNNNQNRENFSRPPRGQDMYDDPMRNDRNDGFNNNCEEPQEFDDDPDFEPSRKSSDFDAPGPNKAAWEDDNKFGGNIHPKSEERKDYNRGSNQYWDEALILKPFTVVDYEHKPLNNTGSTFIEPVQTFDYNHASKNADKCSNKEPQIKHTRESRDMPSNKFGRPNDSNTLKNKAFPIPEKSSPQFAKNSPQFPRNSPQFSRNSPQFSKKSPQSSRNNPNQNKFTPYQSNKTNQNNVARSKPKFNQLDIDDYDDIEEDPFADEEVPEDSFKDKVERFTNVPSYNKEKTSTVTMIEDLLIPPGRNSRPPRMAIILRGPPGSGKTFLAKLIKDKEVEQGGSAPRILSLDDYFMVEQEKEVIEAETGRKTVVKEMVYEYEECMDLAYRQSLERAFKKTITDGYFPFIILDCVNDKVKHFSEMWSFAKQKGFQVYVCQLELDVTACTKRNTHHRSEIEIQKLVAGWEPTPSHFLSLDSTSLIQSGCISEVEMEEVENLNDCEQDEENQGHVTSKWDKMEHSGDKLARLDGISKPLRPKTMEDYLQIDDEIPEERPGIKRVRWADLEERRHQEKIRAVGFVVGQTDWNRMMDPSQGSSALTQTKYIERVRRF